MSALCGKTQFISDLKVGDPVNTVFMVTEVQQRQGKNGQPYLDVKLSDRTGEINLKLWNYTGGADRAMGPGSFIRLSGVTVTEFGGRLQVAMDWSVFLRASSVVDEAQVCPGDFVSATDKSIDEMWGVLMDAIASVQRRPVRCLLESFFHDPEFAGTFRTWPAAVRHHHSYCGGLLEHTVGVLQLCILAASQYHNVDRDFLIAGALLHDVGKLSSYVYDRTKGITSMSLQGVAADHLVLGADQVACRIRSLVDGCPNKASCDSGCWDQRMALYMQHLIVSHHGTKEWGSPVEPATIEACILHFADNMDAQVNKFERFLKEPAADWDGDYRWCESLGRSVWSILRHTVKP